MTVFGCRNLNNNNNNNIWPYLTSLNIRKTNKKTRGITVMCSSTFARHLCLQNYILGNSSSTMSGSWKLESIFYFLFFPLIDPRSFCAKLDALLRKFWRSGNVHRQHKGWLFANDVIFANHNWHWVSIFFFFF